MTVSVPGNARGWFSPERILFVLPILAGLGLAGLLVMAGVVPLVVQLQRVRAEVEEMELKEIGLPALRDRLQSLETELGQRQEQQNRLVALVAGPNQLKTLLAKLNALTADTGVQVTAVETKPVVLYSPPPPAPDPADGTSADALPPPPPTDPLLREGLERRSVVIALEGPYPALLDFLRALESLEVITITDELTLLNTGQPEEPTQLTLSVSAYGRS